METVFETCKSDCGGLNENVLQKLTYLNIQSPVCETVLGGIRRRGLNGRGVSVGQALRFQKMQ